MNYNDIEVGKVYGSYDDASYLVLHKTDNWLCLLHHSSNHKVATPEFWCRNNDSKWIENLVEYEDYYIDEIFENLKYVDSSTLKENN